MRSVLAVILLAVAFIVGVWDVWANVSDRPSDTVSRTLWDWSRAWPILPLLVGVVVGHVWWPQRIVVAAP